MAHHPSSPAEARLHVAGRTYRHVDLRSLMTPEELDATPYALRVLIENVARRAPEALGRVLDRARGNGPACEVPLHPGRVMLHDTTCLPTLADFAALRDSVHELGGDAADINPVIPADLVVDHSVIVESHGRPDALEHNLDIDFRRNAERYAFIRWAERSIAGFRVVPPGKGIIHQVNMESLARVVEAGDGTGPEPLLYPDTLVATDSHTPMINAIGVVGWGVGGLEAQAALLGEPVAIAFPRTVGVRLRGRLREGVTGTDLVLTLTRILRGMGVVDEFVEFIGPGAAGLGWAERAAISNMAPEYGATCAFFPYDDVTADYLRLTGRTPEHRAVVDAYLTAQGLKRGPGSPEPRYDRTVEVDLAEVEASVAGPVRPDQHLPLSAVPRSFREHRPDPSPAPAGRVSGDPVPEGAVAIAAITSCTNTANPRLMVQAGLLARNAVAAGLTPKAWVKTSLSPGSRVVTHYLEAAGLLPALEEIGFHTAGYGCMTCIGNSGPLHPDMEGLADQGRTLVAVLSGNRNFPGRINPRTPLGYLASPPLVVAYALAGTVLHDFATAPLGHDRSGRPVYLADLWPGDAEVERTVRAALDPGAFAANTRAIREGDARWASLPAPEGERYPWAESSTYIRRPPYLRDVSRRSPEEPDIRGARILLRLGDFVTTDHISPAGAIPRNGAAGRYLRDLGTEPRDLNQYSTRRSNHEVMLRGAFTNAAVANLLLPEEARGRGGHAIAADGAVRPVYDAALSHVRAGTPLVLLAGKGYGAGSSRDWAAKAQALLGVRAVIAESFERIHRSNLIGMGVLPLCFTAGTDTGAMALDGSETVDLEGLRDLRVGANPVVLRIAGNGAPERKYEVTLRVDSRNELAYLRNGGLLPYVLRRVLDSAGSTSPNRGNG
ncbi:aconitate hydratase AcnA [Nocardiopsis sediminis]|uniref:Aconitate hydratase n=1 Tax=Nocardiopsis sediminis TaxID=1778267 RepID=A0ABV8FNX9_9ACTN